MVSVARCAYSVPILPIIYEKPDQENFGRIQGIPQLGLGTYQLSGNACYDVVLEALRQGFHSIPAVTAALRGVSGAELQILLSGQSDVTAAAVSQSARFCHFPEESSFPRLLREWLQARGPPVACGAGGVDGSV